MNDQARELERTLRDYPISLRQSARAVFGAAYERAEKEASDSPVPIRHDPEKDSPFFRR